MRTLAERINFEAELAPREHEIANAIGLEALSQKEAAARFSISARTVANTLQNIFRKLNINKNTELTIYCLCKEIGIKPKDIPTFNTCVLSFLLFCISIDFTPSYKIRRSNYRRRNNIEYRIDPHTSATVCGV